MERRFVLFLVLAFGVLIAHGMLTAWLRGPAQPVAKAPVGNEGEKEGGRPTKDEQDQGDSPREPAGESPEAPAPGDAPRGARVGPADAALPLEEYPAAIAALGSADPASPFRMLAYVTSRGAAVERVAFNSPRFSDMDERTGDLGHLALVDNEEGGCRVRVVGPGTPADLAGMKVGDVIESVNGQSIAKVQEFESLLSQSKVREVWNLSIVRDGNTKQIAVTLGTKPLEVIRPEWMNHPASTSEVNEGRNDPLSFLLTVTTGDGKTPEFSETRLGGIDPQNRHWKLESTTNSEAVFSLPVPALGVRLLKTYRLAQSDATNVAEPAYHLTVEVGIENQTSEQRRLVYRLGGPTGLPTEGWWYASKVSHGWGAAGLRDVAYRFRNSDSALVTRAQIVSVYEGDKLFNAGNRKKSPANSPLEYIGVDAQYFSAVMIPRRDGETDTWLDEAELIPVGEIPKDKTKQTLINVSFNLTSQALTIPPHETVRHEYQVFIGPKQPDLLAQYGPVPTGGLGALVYYGWFSWAARPMVGLLHGLHWAVGNYGIAIVLLTVVVRSCMLPVSRKQALAAQKMQELQPEMKRIAEKYKSSPEQRTKAQQELFRKHNYNPLGGCLLLFVQLPIFMGLYRGLMVDVELRQAPLISDSIRWCSNLAAPDMLFRWDGFMPAFLAAPQGWFGPYFNVFPLLTVGLFLWQTIMFTPPPTDEQQKAQATMMKFMTLFMGLMFFKVASGLCLYFIASSLWGIAERKLVPKGRPAGAVNGTTAANSTVRESSGGSNGRQSGKKTKKGRPTSG